MHQNERWVPSESTTPDFEWTTWEIKNMLVAALIFEKSWSLWTKAWLASSLLEQTLKNISGEGPSNRSAIFVQPPTTTQPKETGGQTWSKASTQSEGELHRRMEPVLVLLKISWFFQPIPVFVGNLAQNSTRFFLSNEPFLLIKSCVFFFCAHANNILSTPLYLQNHCAKNLWVCFPFFPRPHVFTRIFGNSKFSTKQKSCWCLFKQTSSENSGDSLER